MNIVLIAVGFVLMGLILFILTLKTLLYVCQPNQVLIFSGSRRRVGGRSVGYRIIKGGNAIRKPFFERVDSLDLTNMIIELNAVGAYSKGGVPLNVQGVANVKVAGHEPLLNNAIERFLGRSRAEIMAVAKSTLEGSLRGVLATLTPEQLNEDRNAFAEQLVQEVEQDMTTLGLVVDTLKIQNITDDVRYLDSIGRIRNSELIATARVAEASARADAGVRSAENRRKEVEAQINAQIRVAKADADKRMSEVLSRRAALVAEEESAVAALLAQAEAEIEVQKARIEQTRRRLEADIVAPAKAECEALENRARAEVASIIEDGRARSEALLKVAQTYESAGDQAREILILQKLEPIIRELTATIAETRIEKYTLIDSGKATGAVDAHKLYAMNEQLKQVFGVDLVEKVKSIGATPAPAQPAPAPVVPVQAAPEPAPAKPKDKPRVPERKLVPKLIDTPQPPAYVAPPPIEDDNDRA